MANPIRGGGVSVHVFVQACMGKGEVPGHMFQSKGLVGEGGKPQQIIPSLSDPCRASKRKRMEQRRDGG